MQGQALASRMNMNRSIPVQRLVLDISDRAQINTQRYGGRPFGVGMLVAGYDVRSSNDTSILFCLGNWSTLVGILALWKLFRVSCNGHRCSLPISKDVP